jgi:UDP-N-acetylglucosamine 2-epimerase (non-hydrolysing)
MRLTIVAGARPNFIKIAPLIHEILKVQKEGANISYRLVHTGQHYNEKLSDIFFRELEIPHPDANLEVGSGTQAEQTAAIMVAFEKELITHPCDLVIVVGDVNSTMACSIVAKKLNIKVAHVEAGIRSFDLSMPEEINRMVTDAIADYFFTTSHVANENLRKSGVSDSQIFFVGNIMIDTLMKNINRFSRPALLDEHKIDDKKYMMLTLHRPSNVDDPVHLENLLKIITSNVNGSYVIFPIHPRTKKTLDKIGFSNDKVILAEPLGYLEFNYLVKNSIAVITDSGGIQEETTVMKVPCVTLRSNTERPETVSVGSNMLVGNDVEKLRDCLNSIFSNSWKEGGIPELWDGKTASRIVNILQGLSLN